VATVRSASFFILSVVLHAAALAYPVTYTERHHGEAIRVTILAENPESTGGGGGGAPGLKRKSSSPIDKPPAAATNVQTKSSSRSPEPQIVAASEVESVGDSNVAATSGLTAPSDSSAATAFLSTSLVTRDGAAGAGDVGMGGNGIDPGSTSGNGNSAGSGSGFGSGVTLTPARYRDTPKPDYPERARREGREGRVLLRVLVDDQGRSTQVEIHSSSGSDALDRAAVEGIKRWRFYPARRGDRPVESWLRIPIEFRLTDATS